jgi:hypothetical protein
MEVEVASKWDELIEALLEGTASKEQQKLAMCLLVGLKHGLGDKVPTYVRTLLMDKR